MEMLARSEKELILAIYFDGLTERQLASQTGLHYMTVHSRKIRILQKLKNLLKK
ncbi:hypothetical protein I3000191B1_22170 [Flavonifractor plautii]